MNVDELKKYISDQFKNRNSLRKFNEKYFRDSYTALITEIPNVDEKIAEDLMQYFLKTYFSWLPNDRYGLSNLEVDEKNNISEFVSHLPIFFCDVVFKYFLSKKLLCRLLLKTILSSQLYIERFLNNFIAIITEGKLSQSYLYDFYDANGFLKAEISAIKTYLILEILDSKKKISENNVLKIAVALYNNDLLVSHEERFYDTKYSSVKNFIITHLSYKNFTSEFLNSCFKDDNVELNSKRRILIAIFNLYYNIEFTNFVELVTKYDLLTEQEIETYTKKYGFTQAFKLYQGKVLTKAEINKMHAQDFEAIHGKIAPENMPIVLEHQKQLLKKLLVRKKIKDEDLTILDVLELYNPTYLKESVFSSEFTNKMQDENCIALKVWYFNYLYNHKDLISKTIYSFY